MHFVSTQVKRIPTRICHLRVLASALIVGNDLFSASSIADIGQQHGEEQDDQAEDANDISYAVEGIIGGKVLR